MNNNFLKSSNEDMANVVNLEDMNFEQFCSFFMGELMENTINNLIEDNEDDEELIGLDELHERLKKEIEEYDEIIRKSNVIINNLSKKRITDIFYYYGEFTFKKRIRDKNYLTSKELVDFIPIKGVFQYKIRGGNEEYISKYFESLNFDEEIFFIGKKYRELYKDNSMRSKFKCSDLLFRSLNFKNLSCSYIVYGLIDNKLVRVIFPISIYIELNGSFDLSKIIKSKNRITIDGDILKNKSVFEYFESNYVEDKFLFEVDRVINRFNISIENREYSLLNQ